MCAGLFGINMFIVAYLQRTARDYSEFKGSMCFLFFGENAVRVVTYLVTDLFTGPVLLFALASVPAAVLAMGLNPNYLKALSALVVAVFLSIPYWKGKYFHASVKVGGADVSAEAEATIGGDRNA